MQIFRLSIFLLSVSFISMTTLAADFSNPENAILSLESAYKIKDLEAAVQAKDFGAEAIFLLQNMNPEYANDADIVKQTTAVLELGFRKQIRDEGFPDFSGVLCSLSEAEEVGPRLVKITETCLYPDGEKSIQDLHVIEGANRWRVVVLP